MLKAFRPKRKSTPEKKAFSISALGSVLRRWSDIVLVVFAVVGLAYVVLLGVEVLSGYSVTTPAPSQIIRLELIDGSGQKGLAREVAARLRELSDLELAVEVVDEVRFDLRDVPRSFIIARTEDKSAALMLAERLGLDPDEVTRKPLNNNTRFVTASLVLGQDASSRILVSDDTVEER